ncbi:hypothetical protein NT03LS_1730, partial [Listeria seeligeri FSL N1-067]
MEYSLAKSVNFSPFFSFVCTSFAVASSSTRMWRTVISGCH